MKLAIIGAGNVGGALGANWAQKGHDVFFGVREACDVAEDMKALGLTPGRQVTLLRRAPFGGPLHLRIGPTELMIRRIDARAILLDRVHRWKPQHKS